MTANTQANGRFHSDWLSMMYSRLRLARNLLRDDGVIFISIDDNEVDNLKKICSEIFGAENSIGMFSVENNPKGRKNGKFISVTNEYCLIYSKQVELASFRKIIPKHANDMSEDENGNFVRRSGKRVLMGENTLNNLVTNFNASKHYSAYIKDLDLVLKKEKVISEADENLLSNGYTRYTTFRDNRFVENTYSDEKFKELFYSQSLDIRQDKIYEKHFSDPMQIKSMLVNDEYEAIFNNRKITYQIDLKSTSAKKQLIDLLGGEYFSFPKNISFIKSLLSLTSASDSNDICLDFFSGSGTTAHAVLQLNAEDEGNRRFIMVQLPELCPVDSEAFKAGYRNIAEVSKERIRRAGKKIKHENALLGDDLDVGFRVLKISDSNIANVFYAPDSMDNANLDLLVDNIKPDRTHEDLLFQVLLNWGVDLTLPIVKLDIHGKDVFVVDDNALVACFDGRGAIDEEFVKQLAKRQPLRVVFCDAGFKDSAVKINVEQIFKLLSPATEVKCI
jgi:adenine-specific DNA-methyltransferase